MYQGLPFKIYRNIKCDTGLGDAPCSNYSILAARDPVGRCKQQEREKLSLFWGLQKVIFAACFGGRTWEDFWPNLLLASQAL